MQKFMGKLCFQGMHLFQTKNFIWQMASLKKYEIVKDNFKEIYGIKVYKIRALHVLLFLHELSLEMQKLFRVQMYANMLKYQIMRSS